MRKRGPRFNAPLGRQWRRALLPAVWLPQGYGLQGAAGLEMRGCNHQFSVTAGTIFADRKRPIRDYLSLSRSSRTARRAIARSNCSRDLILPVQDGVRAGPQIAGSDRTNRATRRRRPRRKEIDGAYFGGHVKPEERSRRSALIAASPRNRPASGKSWSSCASAGGRTLPFVVGKESDAIPTIREQSRSARPSTPTKRAAGIRCTPIIDMRRINHRGEFSKDGACTNQAESYFLAFRRAEIGIHHRISGRYMSAYAPKWRGAKITAAFPTARNSTSSLRWPSHIPVSGQWRRLLAAERHMKESATNTLWPPSRNAAPQSTGRCASASTDFATSRNARPSRRDACHVRPEGNPKAIKAKASI